METFIACDRRRCKIKCTVSFHFYKWIDTNQTKRHSWWEKKKNKCRVIQLFIYAKIIFSIVYLHIKFSLSLCVCICIATKLKISFMLFFSMQNFVICMYTHTHWLHIHTHPLCRTNRHNNTYRIWLDELARVKKRRKKLCMLYAICGVWTWQL